MLIFILGQSIYVRMLLVNTKKETMDTDLKDKAARELFL